MVPYVGGQRRAHAGLGWGGSSVLSQKMKLSTCAIRHYATKMPLLWLITLLRFAATVAMAAAVSECDANQRWRWDPSAHHHPCTISRISQTELIRRFGALGLPNLYPYPLVIVPDSGNKRLRNENFSNLTTQEHLPLNFPSDFNVTLTGSDSLSSNRRTISLRHYLHEIMNTNGGETLPDQLGNETWYLFGETFSWQWKNFLRQYNLPSCHSCTELHHQLGFVAVSFGIGNVGSGVQWHLHGPGFSETIHGRKHWVLYPPENRPSYNWDYASRHWMEFNYPSLNNWTKDDIENEHQNHEKYWKQRRSLDSSVDKRRESVSTDSPSTKKPWECTINSGELIYFPDQWHHATINLDRYTVFVSSFTSEHED